MNAKSTPAAYDLKGFLDDHNLSRSSYYGLKKRKLGPREIRVGRKILISQEAAAEWRREMENSVTPTPADSQV